MPSLIPQDLSAPGTHALVVGVSAYRHLDDGVEPTTAGIESGMGQLSAAARSASEFAAWLLNDYRRADAPLKSLRVLLSPADGEQIHPDIATRLPAGSKATLANVRQGLLEFREACDAHSDNVLIVYFVGHGVQLTKNGAIVLLTDFGAPGQATQLERSIDIAGIHAGMNHPNTARTQFWFVDACRQQPRIARRFERLEGAFKFDVPVGDTETSPIFLAATTGKEAFARVGGVTLFNEALMWALHGGVAAGPDEGPVDVWHIPVTELIKKLPDKVKRLAQAENADQSVDIAGKVHEAVFHELAEAPQVDLLVQLQPDGANGNCTGKLSLDATLVVREDIVDWPFHDQLRAGLYLLNVRASEPFKDKNHILRVKPPSTDETVKVEQ
jgi:hypothetical protein